VETAGSNILTCSSLGSGLMPDDVAAVSCPFAEAAEAFAASAALPAGLCVVALHWQQEAHILAAAAQGFATSISTHDLQTTLGYVNRARPLEC
jgi:hypothetical protein